MNTLKHPESTLIQLNNNNSGTFNWTNLILFLLLNPTPSQFDQLLNLLMKREGKRRGERKGGKNEHTS